MIQAQFQVTEHYSSQSTQNLTKFKRVVLAELAVYYSLRLWRDNSKPLDKREADSDFF
jgi:hypothetical protein